MSVGRLTFPQDFNREEALNFVLEKRGAAPDILDPALIWFDEVADAIKYVAADGVTIRSVPLTGGGGGSDANYVYNQNSASATWGPVTHNLGKFPSVSPVDSAGTAMALGVTYIDLNTLTAHSATPQSGKLYLN